MAIAFVQGAKNAATGSVSAVQAVLSGNATAGNLVTVAVFTPASTSASVTVSDTAGNSYTFVNWISDGTSKLWFFYAKNLIGGFTTITATLSGSTQAAIIAHEYSGADTASPFDSWSGIVGTGTSGSTSSVTVSGSNELVVAFVGVAGTVETVTPGAGYTNRQNTSSVVELASLDDVSVSSSGAVTFTLGTLASWLAMGASFKGVTTAAPVLPLTFRTPPAPETAYIPGVVWQSKLLAPLADTTSGFRLLTPQVVTPAAPPAPAVSWLGKLKRTGNFAPDVAAFLPPYVIFREDLRIPLSYQPLTPFVGRLPRPNPFLRLFKGNASVNTTLTGNASVDTFLSGGAS